MEDSQKSVMSVIRWGCFCLQLWWLTNGKRWARDVGYCAWLLVRSLVTLLLYMFATLGGLTYFAVRSMTPDDLGALSAMTPADLVHAADTGLQAGFSVGLLALCIHIMVGHKR